MVFSPLLVRIHPQHLLNPSTYPHVFALIILLSWGVRMCPSAPSSSDMALAPLISIGNASSASGTSWHQKHQGSKEPYPFCEAVTDQGLFLFKCLAIYFDLLRDSYSRDPDRLVEQAQQELKLQSVKAANQSFESFPFVWQVKQVLWMHGSYGKLYIRLRYLLWRQKGGISLNEQEG